MARKNTQFHQLVAGQSMAATFTSEPTVVKNTDNCSYQINITTSDSTGTFSVEASNDYKLDEPSNVVTNQGNWAPLTLDPANPAATGANAVQLISLNQVPFAAIRLKYTPTVAGTGVMTILVSTKQVGG